MATRTLTGNTNWSALTYSDGDTIALAGFILTVDVNYVGHATGVTFSGTGTVQLTSAPGTYGFKLAANMPSTVPLVGGSSSTPLPLGCEHVIDPDGRSIIGQYNLYPTHPAVLSGDLVGLHTTGATSLVVTGNLTGWLNYVARRTVAIANNGMKSHEVLVFTGITYDAGTGRSTITLSSGLASNKADGSRVTLMGRNIALTFATGSTGVLSTPNTNCAAQCEISVHPAGTLCISPNPSSFRNATVYGGSRLLSFCGPGNDLAGAYIGGFAVGLHSCGKVNLHNAVIAGCTTGAYLAHLSGDITFIGNTTHALQCTGEGVGAIIANGATTDLDRCYGLNTVGSTLNGTTQFARAPTLAGWYAQSDHRNLGGSAGARKTFTPGGTTATQAVVVPTGYTTAYNLALASATLPTFIEDVCTLAPGETVTVVGWLRQDGTGRTEIPRIQLVNLDADPANGGTVLTEAVMTDTADNWQAVALTYTNTGTTSMRYAVRARATNASGNAYAWWQKAVKKQGVLQ